MIAAEHIHERRGYRRREMTEPSRAGVRHGRRVAGWSCSGGPSRTDERVEGGVEAGTGRKDALTIPRRPD